MKVYIVVKETNNKTEYVDCFVDINELIECINGINNTISNAHLQIITKEFNVGVDNDKDILREHTEIPFIGGHCLSHFCKDWSDCTNPMRDCINCPIRGKQDFYSVTWTADNTSQLIYPQQKQKGKKKK